MKSRLFALLKVLISAGLLYLLFRTFDLQQSWSALRGMDLRLLVVAFALFELTLLVRSFRWRFLLDALGVAVPIHRLVYLYYVGTFFNTFLPSGFGGDPVKMYELARYSQRAPESVGTVLVDRLTGIVMLFVMGLLAWPWVYRTLPRDAAVFVLAASLFGLGAVWLFFQERLAERVLARMPQRFAGKVRSLYTAVHTCGTAALWKALGASAVFNLLLFAMNYFIARALGAQVPLLHIIVFMPILSLSMLLPSVGALGTREGAYVLLFGAAGVSEPIALAMSLSFYVINVATGVIGALLYVGGALAHGRVASARQPQ